MSEHLINQQATRYEVRDPLEIRHLLQRLISAHALMSLLHADGSVVLLSTILGIDESTGQLLLDTSADDGINQSVLASQALHCAGSLERIEVRFDLEPLKMDRSLTPPVFRVALPKHLVYLQRREYFRLLAPAHDALYCDLELPEEASGSTRRLQTPVIDLSTGGVAVRVPQGSDELFKAGTTFPNCRLALPKAGVVEAPLLIRHVGEYHGPKGLPLHHAGCEWQGMPMGMQNLIQRYIMRVERERVARERGMS